MTPIRERKLTHEHFSKSSSGGTLVRKILQSEAGGVVYLGIRETNSLENIWAYELMYRSALGEPATVPLVSRDFRYMEEVRQLIKGLTGR